jgi:hypothetical protein
MFNDYGIFLKFGCYFTKIFVKKIKILPLFLIRITIYKTGPFSSRGGGLGQGLKVHPGKAISPGVGAAGG